MVSEKAKFVYLQKWPKRIERAGPLYAAGVKAANENDLWRKGVAAFLGVDVTDILPERFENYKEGVKPYVEDPSKWVKITLEKTDRGKKVLIKYFIAMTGKTPSLV